MDGPTAFYIKMTMDGQNGQGHELDTTCTMMYGIAIYMVGLYTCSLGGEWKGSTKTHFIKSLNAKYINLLVHLAFNKKKYYK